MFSRKGVIFMDVNTNELYMNNELELVRAVSKGRPVAKARSRGAYFFAKRAFDVVASGAAMVVLSPIFLATAIAIKCEDPKGKVVFSQNRVGKDGTVFRMYKFRSMYADAEERLKELKSQNEADGPVFKMKNDPRITKVGHFIRKYSIDELMQLVNVFKGDMSVIGPRPALPNEVAEYDAYAKQRLLVKPGLSCYWQVSGRSNIGFDEWMELDVKYINEMSLLTDAKIVLLTIPAVLKGDGAC
jgi:lipopolysaccharide/colanic/teichoic acid biosynthesis glycosyltransferase